MFCPYCGKPIPDDSSFCPVCGQRIEEDQNETDSFLDINEMGRKKSIGKIVGILILVVVVILAGVGTVYFMFQDSKRRIDEKPYAEKENKTDIEDKSYKSPGENGATEENAKDHESETKETPYDPTEGGIHRYEYVIADVSWNQAFNDCISKGGYLVRINSQEEYQYILNELNSKQLTNIQFFIGGRRDSGSDAYYWVNENGELYGDQINTSSYWCSSEWLDGEPSFSDGDTEEQYLDLLYYKKSGRWTWNDAPEDILSVVPEFSGRVGYICEYDN